MLHQPVAAFQTDPELARALAKGALLALDRMLASQPPDELLPAGELSALVRLIRDAARVAWHNDQRVVAANHNELE